MSYIVYLCCIDKNGSYVYTAVYLCTMDNEDKLIFMQMYTLLVWVERPFLSLFHTKLFWKYLKYACSLRFANHL